MILGISINILLASWFLYGLFYIFFQSYLDVLSTHWTFIKIEISHLHYTFMMYKMAI
jgi:hypothetical protein